MVRFRLVEQRSPHTVANAPENDETIELYPEFFKAWSRGTTVEAMGLILHELVHIQTNGDGHGQRWVAQAKRLGASRAWGWSGMDSYFGPLYRCPGCKAWVTVSSDITCCAGPIHWSVRDQWAPPAGVQGSHSE